MNDAAIRNTPYQIGLFDPAHVNRQSPGTTLSSDSVIRCDPPWKPTNTHYEYGIIGLHKEIKDFYSYISPTLEEQTVRELVVLKVKGVIHGLWPDCQVDVFGSFSTGLYLPTSDIDMVIFGRWEALPLYTLERRLLESGLTSDIKVLDKATVPIVKMTDKDTEVRVDISFNMANSVRAVDLIKRYVRTYPCLPYLVFALKQFLLQRDLNEVWTGGLSSYALILMSVRFLQASDSVRPNITYEHINLGSLLVEFFELYGRKFNYETTAIRVLDGGVYVRKEFLYPNMSLSSRPSILCIEDPLCPTNDVGRRSYAMFQVRRAFEHAYIALSSALLPHYFNQMSHQTALSRIINISRHVIEKRQRIADYANRLRTSLQSSMAIPVALLPHISGTFAGVSGQPSPSSSQFASSPAISNTRNPISWSDLPFLSTGVVSTSSNLNGLVTTSTSTPTSDAPSITFCHPLTYPTIFAPQVPFSRLPSIGSNMPGTQLFLVGGSVSSNSTRGEASNRLNAHPVALNLSSTPSMSTVDDTPQGLSRPIHSRQLVQQMHSFTANLEHQPLLAAIFNHLPSGSPYSSSARAVTPFGFGFPSHSSVLPVPSILPRNATSLYALLPLVQPFSSIQSDNSSVNSDSPLMFKMNDQVSSAASPILLHALAVPVAGLPGPPIMDSRVSQQPIQQKDSVLIADSFDKDNPVPQNAISGTYRSDISTISKARGHSADPNTLETSGLNLLWKEDGIRRMTDTRKLGLIDSSLRRVNSEKSFCLSQSGVQEVDFAGRIVDLSSLDLSPVACRDEHSSNTSTVSSGSNQSSLYSMDADVNDEFRLDDYSVSHAEVGALIAQVNTEDTCQKPSNTFSFPQNNIEFVSKGSHSPKPTRRTLRRPHQSPLSSQPRSEDPLSCKITHEMTPALAVVDLASDNSKVLAEGASTSVSAKYVDTPKSNGSSVNHAVKTLSDQSAILIPLHQSVSRRRNQPHRFFGH
ncbi:unnamed protein product [Protopolystoma xenopodis]|uniref:polynucleotide adenylyltransferase n=1 Tax=Protopolystoma xenopodis TaxID=117903 RepID=A0A3S4ZUC1_9PLAT|nr:unnamed protein product [Protopolystoma xenopodis]